MAALRRVGLERKRQRCDGQGRTLGVCCGGDRVILGPSLVQQASKTTSYRYSTAKKHRTAASSCSGCLRPTDPKSIWKMLPFIIEAPFGASTMQTPSDHSEGSS